MDFTNNKTNEYVCFIQLIKDIDVKVIQYEVDGISHSLILSNKSTYAIYLGTFHHLYLEDYPYYKVRITPFANRFKNCFIEYKISNPKQEIVPYATNGKLFEDEGDTGENTYLCMKRIMNMVMHYVDSRDKNLLDNIVYGLDYLIANFYQGQKNYSGNWWPYEIGIPRVLHEIIFTLYNDLPKEKVFNYLNITSFYVPNALYIFYRRNWPMQKYEVATYANLADNIYIALLKAIMLEDNSTLNYLFRLIKRTLKFTKHNDGFYADGSFIQHKNIPYNASYGEVLLNSLTKLLKIFKLINFNIKEYCQKLINIIKISYEPFLYNHYALEATRGRAVSRKSQDASYSYQIIVKSIKLLANLSDNEYLFNLLNNLENNNYDIEALAFNYMDRYLYRNNEFAITFNNNSAYIANYEAINGENLLGFYQANGTYDLYYNNKNKLEEVINQTPSSQKMIELENRDGHIMWKYTDEDDSAWRELIDLSDIGGGVPGVDSDEIYIGPTEPEDQSIKMWVDTSEDDEEGDVIEIPTKVSELENDMNYITITDLKEKLSISKSDNTLSIYYDNELVSQTQL